MKPILFNTAMVRAILDGRKTQTRRVIKPQPPEGVDIAMLCNNTRLDGVQFLNNAMTVGQGEDTQWFQSKYLEGDILYVRETWADVDVEYVLPTGEWGCRNETIYRASSEKFTPEFGWKPSIHMPQWAARLFLRVTDVRVQRVRSISEADAIAEGVGAWRESWDKRDAALAVLHSPIAKKKTGGGSIPLWIFYLLWESINTDSAFNWDANPWVWVYDFERIEKPEANND